MKELYNHLCQLADTRDLVPFLIFIFSCGVFRALIKFLIKRLEFKKDIHISDNQLKVDLDRTDKFYKIEMLRLKNELKMNEIDNTSKVEIAHLTNPIVSNMTKAS